MPENFEQAVDRAAYETLQRSNPTLLEKVERAARRGLPPLRIYRTVVKLGFPALIASLCWCAAAYVQNQLKLEPTC